jgi:hypothetical protein
MKPLPRAFETRLVEVPLDRLLPSRSVPKEVVRTRKFVQIQASMREVGLIEPLSITAADPKSGLYTILDGHLRLHAARQLGYEHITCLCARDDEAFTYNKRVNRLATVQEHYMILRALERGVSEERLARVLDVNINSIRRKRDLLEGICPEVVELLKDRHFGIEVMRHLKKMKPGRQIECVELMTSLNNFSVNYAAALLAATPSEQLVEPERPKKLRGLSSEQMARMEREMSMVQTRFRAIEASFNGDVLNLVVARGYVGKLLANAAVASYLRRHHTDLFDEFRAIVASASLDEAAIAP